MGLMQSGSNFTDRIVKYVAKRAERKTKPASPPRGHVILVYMIFFSAYHNQSYNILARTSFIMGVNGTLKVLVP